MTDLRDQYARAIRDAVRVRLGTNSLRLAEDGHPVMLNMSEAEAAADAVLAVRDAARPAAPGATCMCGHGRAQHVTVSGRLLCDSCDGADLNVCREYTPLGLMPAARQTTGQDDTGPAPWTTDGRHGPTPEEASAAIGQCGKWGGCILDAGHTGLHRHTPRPADVEPYDHPGTTPAVGQPAEAHDTDRGAAKALEVLASDLSAARKLLLPADVRAAIGAHRTEILMDALDALEGLHIEDENPDERSLGFNVGLDEAIAELRRMAGLPVDDAVEGER